MSSTFRSADRRCEFFSGSSIGQLRRGSCCYRRIPRHISTLRVASLAMRCKSTAATPRTPADAARTERVSINGFLLKRAPGNVPYLRQCGAHLLTLSFTARDPEETFSPDGGEVPARLRLAV